MNRREIVYCMKEALAQIQEYSTVEIAAWPRSSGTVHTVFVGVTPEETIRKIVATVLKDSPTGVRIKRSTASIY